MSESRDPYRPGSSAPRWAVVLVVTAVGCGASPSTGDDAGAPVTDIATDNIRDVTGFDAVTVAPDVAAGDATTVTGLDAANDGGSVDAATPEDVSTGHAIDGASPDVGPGDAGCAHAGGAPSAHFVTLHDRIIRPRGCASDGCHVGSDGGIGSSGRAFDMSSAAAAFANLVNVRGCRGVRVVPCRPDQSYFAEVIRIEDGICNGRRHSFGRLPPDEAAMIDDWIRMGAR